MKGLTTDSSCCSVVHEAINRVGRTNQSAEALCWEDTVRTKKVIALKQRFPWEGKDKVFL